MINRYYLNILTNDSNALALPDTILSSDPIKKTIVTVHFMGKQST